MAKRYKLDPEKGKSVGGNDLLQNVLHVQNLMSSHELEKIQKLDAEMSGVLKKSELTVDEKVRMFEDKLMEFRRVQEKIAREGTSLLPQPPAESIFDSDNGHATLEAVLQKMVEKILKPKPKATPTNTVAAAAAAAATPMFSTPMADVLAPVDMASAAAEAVFSPQAHTPGPRRQTRFNKKRSSAVGLFKTPETELTMMHKLEKALRQKGMTSDQHEDTVYFPVDSEDKAKRKKSQRRFNRKTYDKAMSHLLSSTAGPSPGQTRGLLQLIYQNMEKDSADFADMLEVYPNLKKMHDVSGSGLNVGNWLRLM